MSETPKTISFPISPENNSSSLAYSKSLPCGELYRCRNRIGVMMIEMAVGCVIYLRSYTTNAKKITIHFKGYGFDDTAFSNAAFKIIQSNIPHSTAYLAPGPNITVSKLWIRSFVCLVVI